MDRKFIIILLDIISIVISAVMLPTGYGQTVITAALFAFVVILALFSISVSVNKMPISKERYEGEGRTHYSVYYMICSLIISITIAVCSYLGVLKLYYPFVLLIIVFMFLGDYFIKVK